MGWNVAEVRVERQSWSVTPPTASKPRGEVTVTSPLQRASGRLVPFEKPAGATLGALQSLVRAEGIADLSPDSKALGEGPPLRLLRLSAGGHQSQNPEDYGQIGQPQNGDQDCISSRDACIS